MKLPKQAQPVEWNAIENIRQRSMTSSTENDGVYPSESIRVKYCDGTKCVEVEYTK